MPKKMYDQKMDLKPKEKKPVSVSHKSSDMTVIEIDNTKVLIPTIESIKKRDKIINNLQFETEKLTDDVNGLKRMIHDLNNKMTQLENKLTSRSSRK